MFRFEHPDYLYLLLILPALLLLFLYSMYVKKRNLKRLGDMAIIRGLMPDVALKKQYLKFWLLFVCTALFVLVIAGPQFGAKLETVKKQGIEVMVCLDVSNSMLSTDISPNRLDKSKQILSKLIDNLDNDKVGLIVFAGDAFIQLPITSDYVSAKMFLSSINPAMVPTQGTAIGAAINLAIRSFTPNEQTEKTIILITDGENHEDDALGAAKAATDKKITVHVLGVGSEPGGPIPLSGSSNDFQRDNEGNMIITKLNEQMCQDIAAAGNGMYARTDNTNNALKALQKELDKLSKSEVESSIYSAYDEKYRIPAWILLFLLVVEFFILDRRNRVLSKIKLFVN
ncbi:MAG: VWA domain-containing protein [Dysgonamonadaceae bacterium]|jgi:Ca-activated chloride channel family protein|nr:VWA domain-containing protein [Dysgonamonadaceae bacterium]